ncbi:hypothetical protein Hte_006391 [Hypoxylon texense]
MVATVIRTTTVLGHPVSFPQVDAADMGMWSCLEILIAISVTNAPILHPLFRRWAHKLATNKDKILQHNLFSSARTLVNSLRSSKAATTLASIEYASTNSDNRKHTDFIAPGPLRGVVVDREVSVTTEETPTAELGLPMGLHDWDVTAPKRPLGSYWSVRIGGEG